MCPYTPQHNGIIERVWQTLLSATVALLLTAGLGKGYWQEPFEAFMEFEPIVGHFQLWGVIAFALKHKSKRERSCVYITENQVVSYGTEDNRG